MIPSGQTQLVYKDEEPLAPRSIGDVQQMLERSRNGSQIRHYKIVSGIMFFEVTRTQFNAKRRGFTSYVRYHMVAGEDPEEKGCLVSMHLSPEAQHLLTLHMSTLWDTRGGIVNVAWCTAFHFRRRILPSGIDSRSYSAIRRARRNYCVSLLKLLDDSLDLENQDWQAIQKVIDDHKTLFEECRYYRHRNRSVEPGADDDIDHNDNHGPGPDDSDDDDNDDDDDARNGSNWRNRLSRLRRDRQLDSEPENNQLDAPDDDDDDEDLIRIEDDANADLVLQDNIDEDLIIEDIMDEDLIHHLDDRSSSPVFVPHSRQTSPETNTRPNDTGNLSEIDIDDFSEVDNNRMVITRSSTGHDTPEVKLEPKIEPDSEVTTQNEYRYTYTRYGRRDDPIDLTEDSDESPGGGSSIMEVVDLTEDLEPNENSNRDGAVIDLTQDSDMS